MQSASQVGDCVSAKNQGPKTSHHKQVARADFIRDDDLPLQPIEGESGRAEDVVKPGLREHPLRLKSTSHCDDY